MATKPGTTRFFFVYRSAGECSGCTACLLSPRCTTPHGMVAVVAPAQTERTAWAVLVAVVGLLWGHPPTKGTPPG